MERISTIIDRLKELQQVPGKKEAIDIDLMLDYVRVLYVDLLEARKKFPEAVTLHIYEEPALMPTGKTKQPDTNAAEQLPDISNTATDDQSAQIELPNTEQILPQQEEEALPNLVDEPTEATFAQNDSVDTFPNPKHESTDTKEEQEVTLVENIDETIAQATEAPAESADNTIADDFTTEAPTNETQSKAEAMEPITEETFLEIEHYENDSSEETKEALEEEEGKENNIEENNIEEEIFEEEDIEEEITFNPEEEEINIVQQNAGLGISFEPPKAIPEQKIVIEEAMDDTSEIAAIEEEISTSEDPLPEIVSKPIPLEPEIEPVPEHTIEPVPTLQFVPTKAYKDIRSFIGINDKYLFLNELFNNSKSGYEETLDILSKTANVQDASDWLRQQAANYKWEQDDITVQSFYSLVSRYFSER